MASLEAVKAFVESISPSIHFSGKLQFTRAVYYVQERIHSGNFDDMRVTKDIYPLVARDLGKNLPSTERAIYRAVEILWMDGKNTALNHAIGRALPQRPKPELILRYCAYYCATGKPYHQEHSDPAALLF